MEYKVVISSPANLETALNEQAKDRWRVRAVSAFGVNDFQVLAVLERDKKGA